VLWDTTTETIVNNECSELIAMINQFAKELGAAPDYIVDLFLEDQQFEIDNVAQSPYNGFNNDLHRCGFATTLGADKGYLRRWTLWENGWRLRATFCGDRLTLADVRLSPTLIRFDPVYVQKLEYPNLLGYTLELYLTEGIKRTVNSEHIQKHYYRSHPSISPYAIVPDGPGMSLLDATPGVIIIRAI
jgi:glutathionyl-hydroquinone reductase